MSRSINFLLIAAISAVVLSGCKKERSFRGANPGDEIVFGGTAGSASGFRSSKTKGGDGDSSAAGTFAVKGLDSCRMNTCSSYARDDSDADETYYFDWEDFEGSEGFGGSDANALFGAEDSDVQTKTEYSGDKNNVGGKTYERIDWVVGDKVKIFANGVKPSKTECVYEVSDVTASGRRSSAGLRPFNEADGHGLMWDSGNADFYACYPGNSPAKVSASNTPSNFDVTVKLPNEQNTFTKITSGNHTEFKPDMELAAMLAVSRNVSPSSSVQLDFLPLVTTFRITLSNPLGENIIINKVSLVSTNSSDLLAGNYKVSYTKVGGSTLSSHSGLKPVHLISGSSQEVSVNFGTDAVALNKLSVTLFAVPVQHKGLQLRVNFTKGGITEDRVLRLDKEKINPYAPAEHLEFEPYKKYDINVGIDKKWTYTLEVSPLIDFSYNGGTLSGWVQSYKIESQAYGNNKAPWWVDGYSEIGLTGPFTATKPAWLTNFTPLNGDGVYYHFGATTESVTVSVSAQTPTITPNPRIAALRGKNEVGTQSEPIDLSRVPLDASPLFSIADGATAFTYAGNPMNTANCYVVTRPGWYKIPVVYGNAIKNGAYNTDAYNPSVVHSKILKPFIRHDKQPITDPWIKDNGINLDNGIAELVWQDQPNLVQNIQLLQPDSKYIVFHIDKATIHEGNAVIALKESATGDIVWSWHIWVYGGDNLKTINVKNNKAKVPSRPGQDNFDFLSESLGACYDGNVKNYAESNFWVRISNGRKTNVIKITRAAGSSFDSKYNQTYYEYGRKDPILPSDGTNQNKVWYNKDGEMQSSFFPTAKWESNGSVTQTNVQIANTIKNPGTFNACDYMNKISYYNLWDTDCNETSNGFITKARFEPVKKSVYDPCPPGFCLPPSGAFTGFTMGGALSGNLYQCNVSGSYNNGWNFRTVLKGEPDATVDPTIFFFASGFRYELDGSLYYVGDLGYYWSSIFFESIYACYLYFIPTQVSPLCNSSYTRGFALRPVKEN